MFEKFDDDARRAVVITKEVSTAVGKDHLCTEHLLFAIAQVAVERSSKIQAVIMALGLSPEAFRDLTHQSLRGPGPSYISSYIPFSTDVKEALESARRTSELLGDNHIGPEHLLAGLASTTNSNAGKLLDGLGITEDRVQIAIRLADDTTEASPTAARTFAVFVPVGKSIFKNGGKVYPDLATAQAAHPGQEIAPFPLQLTDGEFFDVWTKYPRPCSWGKFASYPDAFAAAEEFRNVEDADVRISIMTPIITQHPGTDAAGRDVLLGQTVRYERVSVTIRVMDDANSKEGARIA